MTESRPVIAQNVARPRAILPATDNLLDWALYYHGRGWCIIPIPHGQKNARIKWGKYQTDRPDRGQVGKWFGNGHPVNVAVVLGPVSGGLCCRDFDVAESYLAWAKAQPDLAAKLPTVRTRKGYHVYFRADWEGIRHMGDGELRGQGGYCMLPPSVHPDGPTYEWIVLPTAENLIVLNPERAGFLSNGGLDTENPETTQKDNISSVSLCTLRTLCDIKVDEKILAAIERTLPMELGTRRKRVFDFARELKSMPEYADADPRQFVPVVLREWHRLALPNIRTKPFEETAIDFLKAWPAIKYKIGEGPMAEMYERAVTLAPPKVAVEKHPDHPNLITLIALCRELQRGAGESPFFLSCRTGARLLKVSHKQVSRWLFLLVNEKILEEVAKGGTRENPRNATRFRYLGD